jgi:DtxR family Mn-dependent transcriptional regulator
VKQEMNMLTPVQEDYIEIICRLELAQGRGGVRITDIATELGTRLPTVTRTVQKLTEVGLLRHAIRQEVHLTPEGRRIGAEIVHRHDDLVAFFTRFLGLTAKESETDACQIEHGLSGKAAQRLHEFMEHFESLSVKEQKQVTRFRRKTSRARKQFSHIPETKTKGWRT